VKAKGIMDPLRGTARANSVYHDLSVKGIISQGYAARVKIMCHTPFLLSWQAEDLPCQKNLGMNQNHIW
jgi:hypothetical protein